MITSPEKGKRSTYHYSGRHLKLKLAHTGCPRIKEFDPGEIKNELDTNVRSGERARESERARERESERANMRDYKAKRPESDRARGREVEKTCEACVD